jgi:hypothetical protein
MGEAEGAPIIQRRNDGRAALRPSYGVALVPHQFESHAGVGLGDNRISTICSNRKPLIFRHWKNY